MSDAVIAAISDVGIDEAAASVGRPRNVDGADSDVRDTPSSPPQNVILAAGFRALWLLLFAPIIIGVLGSGARRRACFPSM
jgi:hypothetical protein